MNSASSESFSFSIHSWKTFTLHHGSDCLPHNPGDPLRRKELLDKCSRIASNTSERYKPNFQASTPHRASKAHWWLPSPSSAGSLAISSAPTAPVRTPERISSVKCPDWSSYPQASLLQPCRACGAQRLGCCSTWSVTTLVSACS